MRLIWWLADCLKEKIIVIATKVVGDVSTSAPPAADFRKIGVKMTVGMLAEMEGEIHVKEQQVDEIVSFIEKNFLGRD